METGYSARGHERGGVKPTQFAWWGGWAGRTFQRQRRPQLAWAEGEERAVAVGGGDSEQGRVGIPHEVGDGCVVQVFRRRYGEGALCVVHVHAVQ